MNNKLISWFEPPKNPIDIDLFFSRGFLYFGPLCDFITKIPAPGFNLRGISCTHKNKYFSNWLFSFKMYAYFLFQTIQISDSYPISEKNLLDKYRTEKTTLGWYKEVYYISHTLFWTDIYFFLWKYNVIVPP